MRISIEELAILAGFGQKKRDKGTLASIAISLYQSPKFDDRVALATIDSLVSRQLIGVDKARRFFLTLEGHAALLEAIPEIENLRAALANSYFMVRP